MVVSLNIQTKFGVKGFHVAYNIGDEISSKHAFWWFCF